MRCSMVKFSVDDAMSGMLPLSGTRPPPSSRAKSRMARASTQKLSLLPESESSAGSERRACHDYHQEHHQKKVGSTTLIFPYRTNRPLTGMT
jgi:hypothetical protein